MVHHISARETSESRYMKYIEPLSQLAPRITPIRGAACSRSRLIAMSAWQSIRLLRARPPALVTKERAGVFAAALEQSEQLMRAARDVGHAARPLPLFYSVSQAGLSR